MESLASGFKRKGKKNISIYIYICSNPNAAGAGGVLLLDGDAQPQKGVFCPGKLIAKPKEVW